MQVVRHGAEQESECFMEGTTWGTRERVTNQCNVLCGHSVHVCTWNVTRCFYLWRPPENWKLPASEKQQPEQWEKRFCRNHFLSCVWTVPQVSPCRWFRPLFILLFSPGWRSPIIQTLIRLPFIVLLPLRGWRRPCWSFIFPSRSRVNRMGVLLLFIKLLLRIAPSLLCWMDWLTSLSGTFNMFFVQSTISVLRFTKIRSLPYLTFCSFFLKTIVPFLCHRPLSAGVAS